MKFTCNTYNTTSDHFILFRREKRVSISRYSPLSLQARTSAFMRSVIFLLYERTWGMTHRGVYERPFESTKYIRSPQNLRVAFLHKLVSDSGKNVRMWVWRIWNKRFIALLKSRGEGVYVMETRNSWRFSLHMK